MEQSLHVNASEALATAQTTSSYSRTDTSGHGMLGSPSRRRDANRARREERLELLSLRAQVSVLERELQLSRSAKRKRLSSDDESELAAAPTAQVWRETAVSQLKQRVRSEAENQRLRVIVEKQQETIWHLRSQIRGRSTSEAVKQFGGYSVATRLPPFNLKIDKDPILRSHHMRDPCNLALGEVPTMVDCGSAKSLVAKRLLPFGVHATGDAAWEEFTRVLRLYATSSFSRRSTESDNKSVSTVIEYLGMELTHEESSVECRVTQVMRRYTGENRQVIIWESVVDPIAINDCRVEGISFRETGRVLIRPRACEESSAALSSMFSVTEMSYAVETPSVSNLVGETDISGIVLQSVASSISVMYNLIENLLLRGGRMHGNGIVEV